MNLNPLTVNSPRPFVTSNGSVRRNVDAVREIAFAVRRFDRSVREIFRVVREFVRAVRSNLQIRERRVVGVDDFPHFGDGRFQTTLAEQAGAGHKRVRADARTFGGGLIVDAAVHADAIF